MSVKHIIYIFIPLVLSAALTLLKIENPVLGAALSLGFLIFWGFVGSSFYYEYPFRAAALGNAFFIIGMALFILDKLFDAAFLEKISFIKNISSNLSYSLVLFLNAFFENPFVEYVCFIVVIIIFCVGRSIGFNLSIKNKYTLDKRLFKN